MVLLPPRVAFLRRQVAARVRRFQDARWHNTNNASTLHRDTTMKPTEMASSAHDNTDQGSLDGILVNRDVELDNLNGRGNCSLDESMPVFDSTLVEVPFSAAGVEDEKYADGGLSCIISVPPGINDSPELQGSNQQMNSRSAIDAVNDILT
jgi:hypothetical protein